MQKPIPTAPCPCKQSCPRIGDCEACKQHHALHKRYPPYCMRKPRKKGSLK